jgi:hypothetical protein
VPEMRIAGIVSHLLTVGAKFFKSKVCETPMRSAGGVPQVP